MCIRMMFKCVMMFYLQVVFLWSISPLCTLCKWIFFVCFSKLASSYEFKRALCLLGLAWLDLAWFDWLMARIGAFSIFSSYGTLRESCLFSLISFYIIYDENLNKFYFFLTQKQKIWDFFSFILKMSTTYCQYKIV